MTALNFGRTRVNVAPSPATSGLAFTVTSGTGANRLGTGPVVLAPHGTDPEDLADVAEIATISAVAGDTITLSARAVEGTTARAVASGWDVIQGITAAELAAHLRVGTTRDLDASDDQLLRVEINDDGSATAGWPDRFVFVFVPQVGTETRTGYHNEYGELRGRAAKSNTVAFRAMAHPDNTTTAILQVTDDLQSAIYASVSKVVAAFTVPVTAPNIPVDLVRTSDATAINASTTLVTDSVMQFAVAAAGTYVVEGTIIYDCAAAADLKMRFNYSGTGTGLFAGNALTTAATTSATNQSNHAARELNSNFACGGYGTGTGNMASVLYRGILTATGAGTFSIQYAQNTSDASDLVVRAGSHLSYRKVQTS